MDQQQITKQVMDSNKILLENTFAVRSNKKTFPSVSLKKLHGFRKQRIRLSISRGKSIIGV